MSEEYDAGVVAGKQQERRKIADAIIANPNLIASCTHVNETGASVFMVAKFYQLLDGTWVEPEVVVE